MEKLKNRVAIVTGASSGVGYGCALRYAYEGATVVACARRLENLEFLAKEAQEKNYPGKIVPMVCDIAKEDDLDRVVNTTIEYFGKIDILACIAQGGLTLLSNVENTPAENARILFDQGPIYTMLMIQKCLPHMKKAGYGRIITCASAAGVSPVDNTVPYGMAKAAIISLTRNAARDLGQYGITTNCFLPVVKSEAPSNRGTSKEEQDAYVAAMIPMKYLGTSFDDCAPVLVFIASEEAKYFNGQVVGTDGGLVPLV